MGEFLAWSQHFVRDCRTRISEHVFFRNYG